MPLLSGARGGGGRSRRSGDGFLLPRQPPVVVDVGCNCRPARVLSSLYSSLASRVRGRGGGSRPKSPHAASSSSTATTGFTSSTATRATTATTFSSVDDSWGVATYATNTLFEDDVEARRRRRSTRRRRRRRSCGGRGVAVMMMRGDENEEEAAAVAVEVESAAPYEDFRESMVAMVVEKEMYAWEDLNALLHGFLSLNSPRHHPLILHAFADLWAPRAGLFCPPSPCRGL
ncbi:transcription repressor OFP8-like [Lolium rigidum]|uniref:transcription repressor OFP8-like n=1 Tax=Lolium rigidum TaxID=89674 RepID=UPI001F5D2C28|nr:transcription repressor OFP8-like [Lolium rigidum]